MLHMPLVLSLPTNSMRFYTALYPLGNEGKVGTAEDFFKSYLALPVVLFFWACGYLWKRTGWLRVSQIDVDTGRRKVDWDLINATRTEIAAYPAWRRMYHFLF
jgi:amino acid transporter